MYCFSQICRICLDHNTTDFMHLHAFDYDKIKIHEKLKFCVPEIVTDDTQLPENICNGCQLFLQQMYRFKHMCIENTNTLYNYVSKMSEKTKSDDTIKSNLYIAMNPLKVEHETDDEIEVQKKQNTDDNTMFSISLNQWDLFETKHTCRCIKEYSNFTENTEHLCKNCEGDLHGFRLSKTKVGIAENRYNKSLTPSQLESDDSNSNFSRDVVEKPEKTYERGFSYNDILLCKVHVNGVNRQLDILNTDAIKEEVKSSSDEECTPKTIKKEGKYKCTLCDKSYTRRYNLYNHYVTHKQGKFFYCNKCSNKFITEDELKQHEVIHRRHTLSAIKHETSPKKKKLNQSFNVQQNSDEKFHNLSLQEVKPDLNSSDENLICGTCDRVFIHKSHLAIHLMTHFGQKQFKCTECGKEFFRKENLNEHKKLHKLERKYECDRCEKSYNYLSNLRRHQHTHEGQYLCSICNELFDEKDVLEEHIFASHTKPQAPKVYPCSLCKRTFDHIDHLKSHELFSHPRKSTVKKTTENIQHSCKICKMSFSHIDNLKMHESTHQNKKAANTPFKIKTEEGSGHYCPICDRIYSIKTNIRKHLLTHSSGKILYCSICQKQYTNMYLLRQHFKTHSDDLAFKCELCDKAYLTKHNLIRHVHMSHKK